MSDAPIDPRTSFDQARDKAAHEQAQAERFELRQDEIKLGDGQLTFEQISRRIDLTRVPQALQAEQDKERKDRHDRTVFMMLLEDMRKRLVELEDALARRYKLLDTKYGGNVIDGMVDTFLTDAEKAGLENDEEKMRALANKFLNPDGTIKEEYKDLPEAQYLRDWHEAQRLRPVVSKYDGLKEWSEDDRRDFSNIVGSMGYGLQRKTYLQSSSDPLRDTLEQALSEKMADQEEPIKAATFDFAKPI